jgi:hypothetical protein
MYSIDRRMRIILRTRMALKILNALKDFIFKFTLETFLIFLPKSITDIIQINPSNKLK